VRSLRAISAPRGTAWKHGQSRGMMHHDSSSHKRGHEREDTRLSRSSETNHDQPGQTTHQRQRGVPRVPHVCPASGRVAGRPPLRQATLVITNGSAGYCDPFVRRMQGFCLPTLSVFTIAGSNVARVGPAG
jgi:hypothetical protein